MSLPGKRWLNSFKSPGIEEFPDISRTLWTLQSTTLYFAYELNIILKNYFLLQIRHSDGPALSTVVMLSTTAALRALGHTGTVFTGLRDISTPVQYIIFFSPLLFFCHGCFFERTITVELRYSTLNCFLIFENGHYAAGQVYFYKSNSKKSANFTARTAKFSLSKNTGTLKINILFLKFANTFLFLQRTIAKQKIWN